MNSFACLLTNYQVISEASKLTLIDVISGKYVCPPKIYVEGGDKERQPMYICKTIKSSTIIAVNRQGVKLLRKEIAE